MHAREPWNETDLQRAAVGYAELGLRVFPLKPGTKRPRLEKPHPDDTIALPLAPWQDPTLGGFHQGVCDPDLVRAWWSSSFYPGSGIGYAIPPGVIMIDVDGADALGNLKRHHPAHCVHAAPADDPAWSVILRPLQAAALAPGIRTACRRIRLTQARARPEKRPQRAHGSRTAGFFGLPV